VSWNTAPVRLLVIGDSFMREGKSVDRLLKKSLTPRGVAVRNVAYSGYGPSHYLEKMKTEGTRSKPHVVLLGYYVGNDLVKPRLKKGRDGIFGGVFSKMEAYFYQTELFKRFRDIRFRMSTDYLIKMNSGKWVKAGVDPVFIEKARARKVNAWVIDLTVRQPTRQLDCLLIEKPFARDLWLSVRGQLHEIHGLADKVGARLVIVIFPHTFQVNKNNFDILSRVGNAVDERTLSEQRPQELLREFCEEERVDCLDLLPVFRAHRDEALFWPEDEHLNSAGIQLAAENIVDFLNKKTKIGKMT